MKEQRSTNIIFSNEAIAGLVITAMSYLVAYIFERSYLSYFEVPEGLLQVEVKSIILACLSIVGLTGLVYQVLDLVTTVINDKYADKPIAKVFDSYGVIFIPAVILCLLIDAEWYKKVFFLTIPFMNMWFQIIMPFFEIKNYGSYSDAQSKVIEWSRGYGGLTQRYKVFGEASIGRVVLICFYLAVAAHAAGNVSASNQKEYFSDELGRVLIRAYSGNAIMAYSNENKLTGMFVLTPINGLKLKKIESEKNIFNKEGVDSKMYGLFDRVFNLIKNGLS
ncbi:MULTISPECIES: hypothetical protein [Aeromonas]|uniref:hypothetical protein n=1 Tax=Aeromonas TaxID=642 RepID=UPI00191EA1D3|nr:MULTISPECIES: hypothetical protein [Aeromonas]MBL0598251.1 hypothetical protein [Aeromonas jandaei]MCQ4054089.1 hypothetical protein [Aeromonas sp. SG16]